MANRVCAVYDIPSRQFSNTLPVAIRWRICWWSFQTCSEKTYSPVMSFRVRCWLPEACIWRSNEVPGGRSLAAPLVRDARPARTRREAHAGFTHRNKTRDRIINQISVDEQRVVVAKDTDFFYSHLLQGRPWKLLLVKTGNVSTRDLRALFERNLPAIEAAFQGHTLVEIDRLAVSPVA